MRECCGNIHQFSMQAYVVPSTLRNTDASPKQLRIHGYNTACLISIFMAICRASRAKHSLNSIRTHGHFIAAVTRPIWRNWQFVENIASLFACISHIVQDTKNRQKGFPLEDSLHLQEVRQRLVPEYANMLRWKGTRQMKEKHTLTKNLIT